MTDLLIRGLADEVIAALGTQADRLGISRSEYIRRRLTQDALAILAATPRSSGAGHPGVTARGDTRAGASR